MNEELFSSWLLENKISERTAEVISRIRSSPPSRHVQGGRSNVTGRYPSKKMGITIQFESHKVELPFIREYEYDENVLEYYDQPGQILIEYQTKLGRKVRVLTTPDFFVIRRDGTAGWEECKPEVDLERLAEKSERFVKSEEGFWRSPPAEEYAAGYDLYFQVRSSAEINWVWQRNIEYLGDYLQDTARSLDKDKIAFVIALVNCKQGILLSELLEQSGSFTPDDIYLMIARNLLYADLHSYPLPEHERFPIFTDVLHSRTILSSNIACESQHPLHLSLEAGSRFVWDGTPYEIVNVGSGNIWFKNGHGSLSQLTVGEFEGLVKIGTVRGVKSGTGGVETGIYAQLKDKVPADYAVANARLAMITPFITCSAQGKPNSTQYRWLKQYRHAEAQYSCGYLGLLDDTKNKGNRRSKLPKETLDLMDTCIEEHYLNNNQASITMAFGAFSKICEQRRIIPASLKTFSKRIGSIDDEKVAYRRKGKRVAYQLAAFHWELSFSTPRHGDRPFEIAHLDHTELDVQLVDSKKHKPLGKPWLTLLVDAYCRRILAYFISFEPPSYRPCMMVLRECVRRNGRLPQCIVVDRGAEFGSIYFETLVARYNVTKKDRPGAQPRFGSVLERLFGTTNTLFVNNLQGNTQIMKNVRQVTKSVNPANRAIWTLPLLKDALERFLHEIYDTREHPALMETPRDAYESGLFLHGERPIRLVPYDDAFIMSTLPSTSKGTAAAIRSRGVKINNVYYWNEALNSVSGTQVKVRYDPYDIGTAYAYVGKTWVTCRSQYYVLLRGLSEYELNAISAEIVQSKRKTNQRVVVNAQSIAAFVADLRGTEKTLKIMKKAAELKTGNPGPVEAQSMRLPAHERTSATEIYGTL